MQSPTDNIDDSDEPFQFDINTSQDRNSERHSDNPPQDHQLHNKNTQIRQQCQNIDTEELSFLNSSVPSVNYADKYHQQLQQISSLRTQNRALKQDLRWTKNSKEGYQEENYVLKSLLTQKQDICNKLNQNLTKANCEIGRLEDLLSQEHKKFHQIFQNQQNLEFENKRYKKELKFMRKEIISKQEQTKIHEQKLKTQLINQKEKLECQKRKQIQKIYKKFLQILGSSKIDNKNSHNNEQKTQEVDQRQLINVTLSKIEDLKSEVRQKQRKNIKLSQQLKQKEELIKILEKRISIIQSQFNEASSLIQQQKQMIYLKKNQIVNAQNLVAQTKQKNKRVRQKMQKKSYQQIKQLLAILKPLLPNQIYSLLTQNQQIQSTEQLQMPYLKEELHNAVNLQLAIAANNSSSTKNSAWKQELSQVEEQYNILQLKYQTLRRQYEAVTDDNRRLLKFSNLSRYRSQRNKVDQNNKQNCESNKARVQQGIFKGDTSRTKLSNFR